MIFSILSLSAFLFLSSLLSFHALFIPYSSVLDTEVYVNISANLTCFFMVSEPQMAPTEQMAYTAMPSSSSTMASMASSSTASTASINLINQPLLMLSNMSNTMTVKLDSSNYIVWRHQISMVLETYSLFELLDDTQSIPEKFLTDLSGFVTAIFNPEYSIWKSKEKALLTFISSTLTPFSSCSHCGMSLSKGGLESS